MSSETLAEAGLVLAISEVLQGLVYSTEGALVPLVLIIDLRSCIEVSKLLWERSYPKRYELTDEDLFSGDAALANGLPDLALVLIVPCGIYVSSPRVIN